MYNRNLFKVMKTTIGMNAGIVWRYLNSTNEQKCEYDKLMRRTGLSKSELDFALGWLAREDKIEIDAETLEVSLPRISFF